MSERQHPEKTTYVQKLLDIPSLSREFSVADIDACLTENDCLSLIERVETAIEKVPTASKDHDIGDGISWQGWARTEIDQLNFMKEEALDKLENIRQNKEHKS